MRVRGRTAWRVLSGPAEPEKSPDIAAAVTPDDIVAFLRRYVASILSVTFVALLFAVAFIVLSPPIFVSKAQIVFDPRLSTIRDQSGDRMALDVAQVESQIAVLRSHSIAHAVVQREGLANDSTFEQESAGFSASLFRAASRSPAATRGEPERLRAAVAAFQSRLDVARVGQSYAIDISFRSRNPDRAAQLANATAEAYIREQLGAKSEAARQGIEWLQVRMGPIRSQLNAATRKVQEYKAARDYRIRTDGSGSQTDRSSDDTGGPPVRDTLEELEATAQIHRKIYETFLHTLTDAIQRESFPVADARIITPALRPLAKSNPSSSLVLVFGTLVGLLAGCGLAFARHTLDPSVRTPRQVHSELRLECFGELLMLQHPRKGALSRIRQWIARARDLPIPNETSFHLEASTAPFSRFVDCLRRVKASLAAPRFSNVRCIGITSALPREGKSTVSSNLAILYAAGGARTLLVDADVRNASLSRVLAPDAAGGLVAPR